MLARFPTLNFRYLISPLIILFWLQTCVPQYIISVEPNGPECAVVLPGGAKSSLYNHNLALFMGQSQYNTAQTCITYDAINSAYIDARKRIPVTYPKGEWKTEDIAMVGEVLLDVSIQLARQYGLSYEDIEKRLPQIDTSKTLIREICPPYFSGVECFPGKYRRFDGLCNNIEHPLWGATMAPFQRLIGPLYADGINAPRISVTGKELPLSRIVSKTLHPDDGFHDHAGTVMVIAWGQFMDHDFTLTGTPLDPINRNDPEECCKRPLHLKHPYCNEIRIPDDDYFYRLFNIKCIDFVRGFASPKSGCKLGSRTQFNTLTGVIDGNTIYGVKEHFSRKLRAGFGGLLRMNPVFQEYGLKDLLPLKLDIPDEGCTRPNKSMYCFEAGEIRVNEQLVLTCMHTLMAREHNRLAAGLSALNPHWDDETLFQEARRINIAIIQHITFNEFLPILLGKEVMEKFGLKLLQDGYWDGYDPKVNPGIIDAFSSAAFRFGHSLLPTAVERWSKAHKFIASKRLSDLIRRPYDLYRAGVFDEYIMGLMNQVAQAMDDSITQEVTNHLFKKEGARFGMDLVSFNMQRGREFGVPGYMEFRKFCGLPVSDSWETMFGSMPNETIYRYKSIFDHPADIDLWSGGVSEDSLPGSMLGPTFACIIATQLSYIRRGDRFWYELPNQPSSFTPEQLVELRKAKLSRIICDNTDLIDTTQIYPMVLPDHELNPRVACRSGIIPSIDLSKWYQPEYSYYTNEITQNVPVTGYSPYQDSDASNKIRDTLPDRKKRSISKKDSDVVKERTPKEKIEILDSKAFANYTGKNLTKKSKDHKDDEMRVYEFVDQKKSNSTKSPKEPPKKLSIKIPKPRIEPFEFLPHSYYRIPYKLPSDRRKRSIPENNTEILNDQLTTNQTDEANGSVPIKPNNDQRTDEIRVYDFYDQKKSKSPTKKPQLPVKEKPFSIRSHTYYRIPYKLSTMYRQPYIPKPNKPSVNIHIRHDTDHDEDDVEHINVENNNNRNPTEPIEVKDLADDRYFFMKLHASIPKQDDELKRDVEVFSNVSTPKLVAQEDTTRVITLHHSAGKHAKEVNKDDKDHDPKLIANIRKTVQDNDRNHDEIYGTGNDRYVYQDEKIDGRIDGKDFDQYVYIRDENDRDNDPKTDQYVYIDEMKDNNQEMEGKEKYTNEQYVYSDERIEDEPITETVVPVTDPFVPYSTNLEEESKPIKDVVEGKEKELDNNSDGNSESVEVTENIDKKKFLEKLKKANEATDDYRNEYFFHDGETEDESFRFTLDLEPKAKYTKSVKPKANENQDKPRKEDDSTKTSLVFNFEDEPSEKLVTNEYERKIDDGIDELIRNGHPFDQPLLAPESYEELKRDVEYDF